MEVIASASSFDFIEPVTKQVDYTQLLLLIMAGTDEYDATAVLETTNNSVFDLGTQKQRKVFIQKPRIWKVFNPKLERLLLN